MFISFNRWTARRGAQLMDRARPGWARRVNRATLNIECGISCVLGQEYGCYQSGLNRLGFGFYRALLYGFNTPPGNGAALTAAWQAEIGARRTAPVPVRGRRTHDLAA